MTPSSDGRFAFKHKRLDTHPEEIANTCRDSHGGGTPEENAESGAEFGGGTGIGAEGAEDSVDLVLLETEGAEAMSRSRRSWRRAGRSERPSVCRLLGAVLAAEE